jgi:hypothetical protein
MAASSMLLDESFELLKDPNKRIEFGRQSVCFFWGVLGGLDVRCDNLMDLDAQAQQSGDACGDTEGIHD